MEWWLLFLNFAGNFATYYWWTPPEKQAEELDSCVQNTIAFAVLILVANSALKWIDFSALPALTIAAGIVAMVLMYFGLRALLFRFFKAFPLSNLKKTKKSV